MATRATPASAGLGAAESFVTSAYHLLGDLLSAVGAGIQAHKEFRARVHQGADPVVAAADAIEHIEQR